MPLRLLHYSDVENAPDDPARVGRLAAAIDARRDGALVVGTGDNTGPGVLPLVTEGRHALRLYDAISPDVATFGNHDFDFGLEATREILENSPQTWVSANVRRNGDAFAADAGVTPWTIRERAGVRVGFTGVTDPDTAATNPMANGLRFSEPIPAVRKAIGKLRERDVDRVVVCSHLGRGDDDLARAVDADVILGGHVPTARVDRVAGTLLTRPGDGGRAVVEVSLEGRSTATVRSTVEREPDPAVAATFADLASETGLSETLATVSRPMERTEATLFGGESRVGNFVADAYRWKTGADVALQNSGGVRSGEPLAGAVTAADVVGLVPFDEPVAVVEVSGAELAAILSGAAGLDVGFAEPDWWHAQVSGAVLEWDTENHGVSVRSVGGEPVDPGDTYRLATSDFLVETDAEFPGLDADDRLGTTAVPQYEVLTEYARAEGVETSLEGRVRRVN
ncbi:bifunctional metallophosphatase/5'-nucleotidase [Saliphagus infecundisoli]|uniref:Bifunctional metallophosphatase/5'-nucleotidase n=1 Tax=Saliphagus infecundisoli TaxID=1849069 RepID=A0ABD5QC92_9EURY|nr:bifunctional UDP-sugar hydrolase/5'-nucleotidase [Saliphagus infecundisoli]